MSSIIKLIRFNNLLIIAATQLITYYFLRSSDTFPPETNINFLLFILSTSFIAAAGYIINDYFDIKIDMINNPDRVVVGTLIRMRTAMTAHLILNATALIIGFYISWKIGLLYIFTGFLLWQYSVSFKKQLLTGNLCIALLMSISLFSVWLFDNSILLNWLAFYAFFAFLTGLIREISKDVEDMKGDEAFECKTFPIVYGFYKTKKLLTGLVIFLLLSILAAISVFWLKSYMNFVIYFSVILLPMVIYLLLLISKSDKSRDYLMISRINKIIMVSGLLTIIMHIFI